VLFISKWWLVDTRYRLELYYYFLGKNELYRVAITFQSILFHYGLIHTLIYWSIIIFILSQFFNNAQLYSRESLERRWDKIPLKKVFCKTSSLIYVNPLYSFVYSLLKQDNRNSDNFCYLLYVQAIAVSLISLSNWNYYLVCDRGRLKNVGTFNWYVKTFFKLRLEVLK